LRQSGDKRYSGTFVFDSRDPVFAEHFPGNPVVPGTLIVQAFLEAARKFGLSGEYRRVERFRFKRFVRPGEYRFLMEPVEEGYLKCTLKEGRAAVATGRLSHQAGPAGPKTDSEAALRATR
jgi:3-hydroxyacyl-[acyl-carrier-protein] dehydratase